MKKIAAFLILLSVTLVSSFAVAHEPPNLVIAKQELIRYHDSNQYEKDIGIVANKAIRYLRNRLTYLCTHDKKPAIVLDIDETALSNYPSMLKMSFGGTLDQIREAETQGTDPVIAPVLKLYQFAKVNHIAVFFITGRYEEERSITEKNLRTAGYTDWDGLIFRAGENKKKPASVYKTEIRKKLAAEGYDILLNVGDQKSDLVGGYAEKTFKLPNPYYLIP